MRLFMALFVLPILLACNPGKLMEGRNAKSETASTAAPEIAEQAVETSVIESEEVANEPVSVGGAFLTCRYKSGQNQGSASYQMECDVGPIAEVTSNITQADFYKVDSEGERFALSVSTSEISALKWVVLETAATLPFTRVEAVLSATNQSPVTLATTLESPLILAPLTSYWLGGEPNNLQLNPEGEDCVEFGNLAAKVDHQNRSGFTSGPLGRLNDINCNVRVSSFLCRSLSLSTTNRWVVSTFKGGFLDSKGACPEGYSFGFPINDSEVSEVSALIDGNTAIQNIWVNMNDRTEEGKFSVLYR